MFSRRPVQYLGLALLVLACVGIIFFPIGARPQDQTYTITLESKTPFGDLVGKGKKPEAEANKLLIAEFKSPEKLPGELTLAPDGKTATIEDHAEGRAQARSRTKRIVAALGKSFPSIAVTQASWSDIGNLPPKPLFALGDYAIFEPRQKQGKTFPAIKLGLDLQGGVNLVLQLRQALFVYKTEKPIGSDQNTRDLFASQVHDALAKAAASANLKDANVNLVAGSDDEFEVRTQASSRAEFENQRKVILETLTQNLAASKIKEARDPQFFQPDESVARSLGLSASYANDLLDRSVEIIRSRVDKLGVSEPLIQKQLPNRIVVQLPGVNNPQQAVEVIGKTAQMTIVLLPEDLSPVVDPNDRTNTVFVDKSNNPVPSGEVLKRCIAASPDGRPIVTGGDLKPTSSVSYDDSGKPAVHFDLQGEGSARFAQATAKNIKHYMPIFLDEKCISCPTIQSAISGSGQISGGFKTIEEARELALLLNSGALPAPIDVVENRTVSATLGTDSLIKSIKAGLIGIMAVVLFMVFYYRLPGFLANIALGVYFVLNLAVFILVGGTLTLPGIAGFLLAVAMSLDTNILVFERLKEEMVIQPTFAAALRAAFSRAWTAILDSHVTTLIAATVLFYLGTGPVKGFALTLGIGVLLSLFSAISVTRLFMWSVSGIGERSRNLMAGKLPDPAALALKR